MLEQYRYSMTLDYDYNGTQVNLDSTNISNVVIDYDYDNHNMPTIVITANIDKNIVDDMIANCKTKVLNFTIYKYLSNSSQQLKEKYISGQFIYFTSNDDLNNNSTLDYSTTTSDSKDIYRKITLGLMMQSLIDNNKITINDVIETATLSSTILHYFGKLNLLLEPVNNYPISSFVIPAINSRSKLISFLDNAFNLYDNKYRLFYDFNRTYLLSSSGNAVQTKDESITSIIIKADDTTIDESKLQGMDNQGTCYMIDVNADDIHYYEDNATTRTNSAIMAIGSNGDYSVSGTGDKYKIIRVNNDNVSKSQIEQSDVDNTSFAITLMKTELDTSVLTINKEYRIQNYDKLQDKDGKFLLSRKREVYTQDNGDYVLSNILTFRKAIS